MSKTCVGSYDTSVSYVFAPGQNRFAPVWTSLAHPNPKQYNAEKRREASIQ